MDGGVDWRPPSRATTWRWDNWYQHARKDALMKLRDDVYSSHDWGRPFGTPEKWDANDE